MSLRPRDLWNWQGETTARDYALWGALLFVIKYNLDRLIVWQVLQQTWYPWNYVSPHPGLFAQTSAGSKAGLLLIALSLPFIFAGLVLTLRRLRMLRWPLWLTALFFAPVLNLVFFAVLVAVSVRPPGADAGEAESPGSGRPPVGRTRAALLAIAVSAGMAVPVVVFGTIVLQGYGLALFVGLPFCMGMIAALIHGARSPRSLSDCISVSLLASLLCGIAILALAIEGAICLVMAAPIAAVLATFGGLVGYVIQRGRHTVGTGRICAAAWSVLPLAMLAERADPRTPPVIEARSSVIVSAPPAALWRHVVAFSELPPPAEAVFRAGIAYPIRARIEGRGVGAVRYCEFSTGAFVEPITAWEEGRRLAFDVASQPHPMHEWSPYRGLKPPHLDGFFRSRRGEFRLTAMEDGTTRLEGSTWYEQNIWPNRYWRLWSDHLIHRIHDRVLRHIRAEAERDFAL
jgi:hypothetical protein